MVDTENKAVQTDPRPASPARKPDLFRKVTRQAPVARPAAKAPAPTPPPAPVAPKKQEAPQPTPAPRPRLDQPKYQPPARVQAAEPREPAAARVAPSIQLADPIGEDVAHSLPHAADGLPAAHRPTLAPKKQPRMFLDDIKIPTSLFKRRGAAAAARPASAGAVDATAADDVALPAVPDASPPSQDAIEQPVPPTSRRVLQKAAPNSSDVAAGRQNPGLPMPKLSAVQNSGTSKAGAAQTARAAGGAGPAGTAAKRPAPQPGASASHLGSRSTGVVSPAALGLSGHGTGAKGVTKPAQASQSLPASAASPEAVQGDADVATMFTPDGEQDLAQSGVAAQNAAQTVNGEGNAAHAVNVEGISSDGICGDQASAASEESAAVDQFAENSQGLSPDQQDLNEPEQPGTAPQPEWDSQLESDDVPEGKNVAQADSQHFEEDVVLEAEPSVPYGTPRHHIQRTVQRRIRHHRAAPQQPSALQPQISAVYGEAPEPDSLSAAAVNDIQHHRSVRAAAGEASKRAQHGSKGSQKVPSLNLEIMRHLRQQISGLVPLDSKGSPKMSQAASARTPFNSQRTAKTDSTAVAAASTMASTARSSDASRLLSIYPFRDMTRPKADDASSVSTEPPMAPTWPSKVALSLDATVQLITDIYDSKSVADIAALRQQAQCKPMRAFVQQYLQRRFGTAPGAGWQQAWLQLQAAVLNHASDDRIASFGITSQLLASPADSQATTSLTASSAQVCALAWCAA